MKVLVRILLGIIIAGMTAWGAGAIYYSPLPGDLLRTILAVLFAVATALAFLLFRNRRRTLLGFFIAFAIVVGLFFTIPASNERDWQPDVARTPYATIEGDSITVHNIRNFNYRTETDFDPRWESRTYDLSKLDSVDIIAVYWAGKAIAHVMLSFGFEGKDYLAVSIETRKEKAENYSTLAGFFRHYELYYVAADERDVIGVRTNYRQPQEDVYVYRVNGPVENARRIFLDYVRSMNDLRERPSFYNTLTTNCTTSILMDHVRCFGGETLPDKEATGAARASAPPVLPRRPSELVGEMRKGSSGARRLAGSSVPTPEICCLEVAWGVRFQAESYIRA